MRQMIQLQFPSTLGMDFSGVIKQIGEGVSPSDFKQGDEVYGQAIPVVKGESGAFAEMALASRDKISHKQKYVSHTEADFTSLWVLALGRPWSENLGLSKDKKDPDSWWRGRDRIYCRSTCKAPRCTCSNNSE